MEGNWVLTWNRKSFPWLELTEQVRRIRSSKENATSINDTVVGCTCYADEYWNDTTACTKNATSLDDYKPTRVLE